MTRASAALVAGALGAMVTTMAWGRDGGSPLVPPGSHAFGKSFEAWNVLWARRAVESELGGGDPSDTVGRVRLLPTVVVPGTYEFDISVPPGTPLVSPPFFVFGELYDDGSEDTPQDVIDLGIFETAEIRTALDGQVLVEGTGTELASLLFGPVDFDEPITYEEPQFRFVNGETGEPVNAVAALWVVGIGSVLHPLPPGRHTLVNTVQSAFFGDFHFTYHITVSPR